MKKTILPLSSAPHAPKAKLHKTEGRTCNDGTHSALKMLCEGDL